MYQATNQKNSPFYRISTGTSRAVSSSRCRFTLHGLLALHSFARENGAADGGTLRVARRDLDARLWGEAEPSTARKRTARLLGLLERSGYIRTATCGNGKAELSFTPEGLKAASGDGEFVFLPESFRWDDFRQLDPMIQKRIAGLAGAEGAVSELGMAAREKICAFMRLKLGNHALSVLSALSMRMILDHAKDLSANPKDPSGRPGMPVITMPSGLILDSRGREDGAASWRSFIASLKAATGLNSTQIREGLDMLSRLGIIEEQRCRARNLGRISHSVLIRLTRAAIGWLFQISWNAKRIANYVAGAVRKIFGRAARPATAPGAPAAFTAASAQQAKAARASPPPFTAARQ